jgi:hypothetical protein
VVDSGVLPTKITSIYTDRIYSFVVYKASWSGDLANLSLEFLDVNDNVLGAIRTSTKSTYAVKCEKGTSLSSMMEITNVGTNNPILAGELSFSSTQIIYTTKHWHYEYIPSFTIDCNASSIVKIRASNVRISSNYTGGTGGAFLYLQQRDRTPGCAVVSQV